MYIRTVAQMPGCISPEAQNGPSPPLLVMQTHLQWTESKSSTDFWDDDSDDSDDDSDTDSDVDVDSEDEELPSLLNTCQ
jgi:hypothetical protein